jgi:hypothetical protein
MIMRGGIVMCKAECVGCGQLVDVSDLMHREMLLRYGWRISSGADYSPDLDGIYVAHPVIEGCHERCDRTVPRRQRRQWVRYKRCKLPGCCLPREAKKGEDHGKEEDDPAGVHPQG